MMRQNTVGLSELSGKQLFSKIKETLITNNLIRRDAIEGHSLRYIQKGQKTIIDLGPYFFDYTKQLSEVPTYVSDSSYVLKRVHGIVDLINKLKQAFPLNSSSLKEYFLQNQHKFDQPNDFHKKQTNNPNNQQANKMPNNQFNLQVQLLSKQFGRQFTFCYLMRYIYYQVCGQWLKQNVALKVKFQSYRIPIKQDEGFFNHNVRILGQAINDAYLLSNSY